MADEPENLVLELLRGIRADAANTKAELKTEIHSLRADVASDLLTTRKEIGDQIVGLRKAVIEYHSTSSVMAA